MTHSPKLRNSPRTHRKRQVEEFNERERENKKMTDMKEGTGASTWV